MRTLLGVDPQVLVLAVARMAESIGNSFLIVVLPLYVASDFVTGSTFGLTEVALTGVVLALFGMVNAPLQPVTGRISDRVGQRKVFVLIGLVILAGSSGAYALATTYWHLLGLRAIQGLAGALIIPTTVALVNDLASEGNRGGNMGTYNTFRLMGFGGGPIAAGVVVAAGPYRLPVAGTLSGFEAAFALAASTALLSFLFVLVLIRDPDIEPRSSDSSGGYRIFDTGDSHLFDPVFALGLVSFFMTIGIALFATLGEIVNTQLDQGPGMFGLQFSAFVLAQVLFQAPIGRATDFYGRKVFILAGTALLVPTTLVQGLILDPWLLPSELVRAVVVDPWVMVLARFLQGVGGAMVFAPALALAGDLASEGESGSTLSVLTMSFMFGVAIGPVLSGFLVSFSFVAPFAFAAFLAALGVVIVATQVEEIITPRRQLFAAD